MNSQEFIKNELNDFIKNIKEDFMSIIYFYF